MALENLKSIFGPEEIKPDTQQRSIHEDPNNFHVEDHSVFDNLQQPNFTKLTQKHQMTPGLSRLDELLINPPFYVSYDLLTNFTI